MQKKSQGRGLIMGLFLSVFQNKFLSSCNSIKLIVDNDI